MTETSTQEYVENVCQSQLRDQHIPFIRSTLYTNSFKVFQKLHQNLIKDRIDEAVKEYGNALQDYIDVIEQYHYPIEAQERDTYKQLLSIWKLTELLQFNTSTPKQLMTWFNEAYRPLYFEYSKQAILYDGMLNRHDFWLYAIRMAVLGQLQQISLLFQHVLKSNAFSQFNDVLTCMLDVRNHINNDKIDYGNMQKALLKLQHMNFTDSVCQHHANQLGIVMSILLGYEHIILQHTKSDIHALICSAYYQPQTPTSIESFATAFYTKHSQFPSSMIRSLMINDLYAAIEQSLKLDWWFLAHWTDLLTLRNMLDRPIEIQTTKGILPLDIKHHFILHYASFLKNQLGQWKEAFSYSLDCSDIGRRVVIKHLEQLDLKMEGDKLQDVIEFCHQHALQPNGHELYKKKAARCLEQKDYKNAIHYYNQAQQYDLVDNVFYEVIKNYAITGKLVDVTNHGEHGMYYNVYCQLVKMTSQYQSLDFKAAVTLFKQFVQTSESIPSSILPIIIWENLILVDDIDQSYMTQQELLELKKVCQKLSKETGPKDFELFHYFLTQDTQPTQDQLHHSMNEFLDTTAVKIARAIERTLRQSLLPPFVSTIPL